MSSQATAVLEAFEQTVFDFEAVQDCSLVTGSDADYLLKVVMPDMAYYEHCWIQAISAIDSPV